MRTRNKRVWLGLAAALVLIATMSAAVWWHNANQGPEQYIKSPDGMRYRFAGVTYSTRNVPPTLAARVVSLLPERLAKLAKRYVSARISQWKEGEKYDSPQLIVWFERVGDQSRLLAHLQSRSSRIWPIRMALRLAVMARVVFARGVRWCYVTFPVFPRRSRVLVCNLYHRTGSYAYSFTASEDYFSNPVAAISFLNPAQARFPKWQPEGVPRTNQAGDLDVWLEAFMTGSIFPTNPVSGAHRLSVPPGQLPMSAFDIHLDAAKGTNGAWLIQSATLSDATGNAIFNASYPAGWSSLSSDGKTFGLSPMSGSGEIPKNFFKAFALAG